MIYIPFFFKILFGDEEKITLEKFLANGLEYVKQLLAMQKVIFWFSHHQLSFNFKKFSFKTTVYGQNYLNSFDD